MLGAETGAETGAGYENKTGKFTSLQGASSSLMKKSGY